MDSASAHLGKVARMVNQVKKNTAVSAKNWLPTLFESCADDLDESDFQKGNDAVEKRRLYSKLGRPYLVSAGIDKGISYIFVMTPFMAETDQG